ncbi:MAG: phosphoribosylformylglycinamidine cyclo-ligase [Armatimonadota bacterium]
MKYRVNVELGDLCSKIAYGYAKKTFKNRKGSVGSSLNIEGGFSGLLDFGSFCLCFNSDGTGTKSSVAHSVKKYDTLGCDLVAMVADDAVTLGAEPVSMINNLDIDKVNPGIIKPLMRGLEKAAETAGITVAGGEIAEVPDLVKGICWNAALIGIVDKNKVIDGSRISKGDKIIGLLTDNFRSNGFTLIRDVLKKKLGDLWHNKKYSKGKSWGEAVLAPSKIFTPFILDLAGRYKKKAKAKITGIAHITGGGIYNNIKRIIPGGLKADIYNIPEPPKIFKELINLGSINKKTAYNTFNMGVGMVIITPESEKILKYLKAKNLPAEIIGVVK